MVAGTKSRAGQLFGAQLKRFRAVTGLTQKEFSAFTGTTDSYLGKVERGIINIGADNMEMYASTFGVKFYELANPNFPVPKLEEMPNTLQEYVYSIRNIRKSGSKMPALKITKYLDPIIESDFLTTPRTAKMIAEEIKMKVDVTIPPGRITSELTKAPRNAKVKVVSRPANRKEPGNWYQLR